MNTQIRAQSVEGSAEMPGATRGAVDMERQKARRIDQISNVSRHDTDQIAGKAEKNRHFFQTKSDPNSHDDSRIPRWKSGPRRSPAGSSDCLERLQDDPPDLRRRSRREYAQTLVGRAAWLPAGDRELIEAVFGEGLSVAAYVRRCRELGTDVDVASAGRRRGDRPTVGLTARTARRRLRRLITRLLSPRFAFVIASRTTWSASRRRVAMTCVVHGRSLREAAGLLGMSLHAVRRHIDAVDALYTAQLVENGRGRVVVRGQA